MFNVYSNFQILIEYLALSLQGYIKKRNVTLLQFGLLLQNT